MIVCSSCKHEELVGALFCSECGATISYLETSPTETLVVEKEDFQASMEQKRTTATPNRGLPESGNHGSIKMLKTGETILLEDGEEFILGRIGGKQPILPDIDLTPFGAYEEGVSRLHALVKVAEGRYTITDLGSANGTWVNDTKTSAHNPYPLENGDILTLGKFKAIILIR